MYRQGWVNLELFLNRKGNLISYMYVLWLGASDSNRNLANSKGLYYQKIRSTTLIFKYLSSIKRHVEGGFPQRYLFN